MNQIKYGHTGFDVWIEVGILPSGLTWGWEEIELKENQGKRWNLQEPNTYAWLRCVKNKRKLSKWGEVCFHQTSTDKSIS